MMNSSRSSLQPARRNWLDSKIPANSMTGAVGVPDVAVRAKEQENLPVLR